MWQAKFKNIFIVAVFLLLSANSLPLHAKTCGDQHITIEKAFSSHDIIFLGEELKKVNGGTVFQVVELFKSYPDLPNSLEKIVVLHDQWMKVPSETSWIIYADIRNSEDGNSLAYISSCGPSHVVADQFFEGLISEGQFSNQNIFQGILSQIDQTHLETQSPSKKAKIKIDQIMTFPEGEPLSPIASQQVDEFTAVNCNQELKVGSKYVFAMREKKKYAPNDKKKWKSVKYLDCTPHWNPMDLGEIAKLRKLKED